MAWAYTPRMQALHDRRERARKDPRYVGLTATAFVYAWKQRGWKARALWKQRGLGIYRSFKEERAMECFNTARKVAALKNK